MILYVCTWGIGFKSKHLVIRLVLGDLYLKMPFIGECAWNSVGFCFDRWTWEKKKD